MRFALPILAGALLFGCSAKDTATPTDSVATKTPGGGTVVTNRDGSKTTYKKDGDGSPTHTDGQGNTIETSDKADLGKFKGLSYPESKHLADRSMSSRDGKHATYFAAWSTEDAPAKVAKFYEGLSPEAKAVTTKTSVGTAISVFIPRADQRQDVQVSIMDMEGVTEIAITINEQL